MLPEQKIGKIIKEKRTEKKITQEQLARLSDVPYTTLTKVESGVIKNPSSKVISKLAKALEITVDSILSPKVFHGPKSVIKIWEDILETLKNPGDSMCISGISEGMYLSSYKKELLEFIEKIKLRGFKQKLLSCEGDKTFIKGDHIEYRWIPKKHFNPTPAYVYGNKVTFLIWGPPEQVIIIENEHLADAYRKQFLFIWEHAKVIDHKKR